MIYCNAPTFETWLAPPQEDFPRPTWTKLFANGQLLSNSIEYANWNADPTKLWVCEQCWSSGCSGSGLTRIVRLSSQVLWLRPRLEHIDTDWLDESSFIPTPLLMPRRGWDQLSNEFSEVPAFEELQRPTKIDLFTLWIEEMPDDVRTLLPHDGLGIDNLSRTLRRNTLATDPLSFSDSVSVIERIVEAANEDPASQFEGDLLPIDKTTEPITSLFFDGPLVPEWRAFTTPGHDLVIGNQWVLARHCSEG
ncbi:MAG: hypothetical protein CMJ48_03950 [Planctomycetaceae bacterium]|nr:hypothetical protein [Planctomycetaceae bacterium]